MIRLFCVILLFFVLVPEGFAYKVYYYDACGKRIYRTIEQKDFAKYKNRQRRSYVRTPRTNWEITDAMRARKRPFYYEGKY